MRLWISVVCAALCVGVVRGQADEATFRALDRELKFKLSDEGEVLIAPDPSTGLDDSGFTPFVPRDPAEIFANAGVFGWLAVVYRGDVDFASIADSEAILRRLGLVEDVELFQRIGDEAPARHRQLLRLMAVRRAQARGLKAAIAPLRKALESGIDEPCLERAMREAIGSLSGQAVEPMRCSSLESALKLTASSPDLIWLVDCHRLPALADLLRWGREVGLEVTQAAIREAGGSVSLAQWAGAVKLSEGIACAPYELARRFGNHRPTRILATAAGRLDADDYRQSTVIDGLFDFRTLGAALVDAGFETELRRDSLWIEPMEGAAFEVGAKQIRGGDTKGGDRMSDEQARAFAEMLTADRSQIVIWMRDGYVPGDLPSTFDQVGLPRRIGLEVPESDEGRLRLRVTCPTTQSATVVESLIGMVPRQVESFIDMLEDPEPFDPLLDCVDDVSVVREDCVVTASMPVKGLDLRKMTMHLARTGEW